MATYTGRQSYATTTIAPTEIADPELGRPLEWISVLGTTGVTAYACPHLRTEPGGKIHSAQRDAWLGQVRHGGDYAEPIAGGREV